MNTLQWWLVILNGWMNLGWGIWIGYQIGWVRGHKSKSTPDAEQQDQVNATY